MEQYFAIHHPDQLKRLAEMRKDCIATKMLNAAKVWSVAKRQKETTPWDGRFFVAFIVKGRERGAYVFRFGTNDKQIELGWLKYTPALKWCKENLESIPPWEIK